MLHRWTYGAFRWYLRYLFDLLYELVAREMKLLYKRSVLGVAWTFMNPLLQLAVFSFVFQQVLEIEIPNFSSYAFSGLLIWNWFQNTLFQSTGLITNSRSLLRQPRFPVAILPLVTITSGFIHFAIALPILVIFLAIDGITPQSTLIFLPVLFVLQFLLIAGFAYPLAALNVTFRDTQHTLGILLQMLFYLAPIFYRVETVPEAFQGFYSLNPMVVLLEAYRSILLAGYPPDWQALSWVAGFVLILLPIGYRFFKHQSQNFVEEL